MADGVDRGARGAAVVRGHGREDRRGDRRGRPPVYPASLPRLQIVHEDADVVVVGKPPGLLSARMPGEERDSLFDLVKLHVRGKKRKPVRVWIVHRLDKEASGLLVFAKTEKAFNWLKEDLRAKRMSRVYVAVVEGEIRSETENPARRERDSETGEGTEGGKAGARFKQPLSGTIQSFIRDDEFGTVSSVGVGEVARESARGRRDGREGRGRFMGPLDPDAPRLAVTHWRLLGSGQGRSLLQLRLDTGRKNQIRVHMREFKHPIIGDARYGAASDPIGRLALHASELGFTHPGTGQAVRFVSPAPAEFFKAVGMEAARGAEPGAVRAIAPAPDEDAPAIVSHREQPPEASLLGARGPEPTGAAQSKPRPVDGVPTSWDNVAPWYDRMIEEERSDHFRHVIVPGTLRLLRPAPGMRVLDIACGQGSLCRRLAEGGVEVVGVDASARLIEAARAHAQRLPGARFEVADARFLGDLAREIMERPFDAAACVMALMNIDPLEPVIRGAAGLLKPGGVFVGVILHPAFRAPGQTSWGWEERGAEAGGRRDGSRGGRREHRGPDRPVRQFRRVDGYLSPGQMPITMNPGYAAHGAEAVQTWTFHRPVQTYVRVLAEAGFLVEALEEWPSMRRSQPGPRAAEEDRARREIPMFLGFRAVKTA